MRTPITHDATGALAPAPPPRYSASQQGNTWMKPAPALPWPLCSPPEIDAHADELPLLASTLAWTRDFLARPHPDLGRSGSVCPYIPRSLTLPGALWFAEARMGVP